MTAPAHTGEGGRELDERIAREVMGFHDLITSSVNGALLGLQASWQRPKSGNTSRHVYVPHYSTSIADAWLVVDKLMERAFDVQVIVSHESGCSCLVRVGLTDSQEFLVTDALTVPLAICKAALACCASSPAIGGEKVNG